MADYLKEINHAVSVLIGAAWYEQNKIEQLRPELERLKRHVEREYVQSEAMQATAETADDLMMGVGRYWENYFGADKERHEKDQQLKQVEQVAAAHQFSIGSLSGRCRVRSCSTRSRASLSFMVACLRVHRAGRLVE